jgi:hypothetical protein
MGLSASVLQHLTHPVDTATIALGARHLIESAKVGDTVPKVI